MLYTIFRILGYAITIYSYLIIINAFLSWVPNLQNSSFGRFVSRIVEPYLAVFRRVIPPLGMIDISPIVALIVLWLARSGLDSVYYYIAQWVY